MAGVLDASSPISGEPAQIEGRAHELGAVAESLSATIAELRSIRAGTSMRGDAVAAYLEAAEVIEHELGLVERRYAAAAAALADYARSLSEIRAEGDELRRRAAFAHTSLAWAEQRIAAESAQESEGAGVGAILVPALRRPSAAESEREEAALVLSSCAHQFDELLARWRAVADARAREIDVVVESSALNDSGWDVLAFGLERLLDEVLPVVELVLDVVALVTTVAAVVLVLTGVGAPLASALFLVSRLAQAGARVAAVIRVVATATLVATGRRPARALAELGVGLVVDRAGGRAGDMVVGGVARRAPAAAAEVIDRAATGLVELTGRVGPAMAGVGAAAVRLRAVDFDGWIEGTLNTRVAALTGRPSVVDPDGLTARFDAGVDAVVVGALEETVGAPVGDAYAALLSGLDAAAGTPHALSGTGFHVVDVAREIDGVVSGPEPTTAEGTVVGSAIHGVDGEELTA
ncbi:hypothetical protein [Demequina sp. NBRC 110054]|uniref:hypothetical protein n=1 Tax=Demequina sp. NBRC 110054 TaxID=1570343 RepID=UPI000A0591C6|nr:hypothetical protein [Demequina sp. NBRC 110054]